eukprot:1157424-Pelagomonas_calceolata.AAC.2
MASHANAIYMLMSSMHTYNAQWCYTILASHANSNRMPKSSHVHAYNEQWCYTILASLPIPIACQNPFTYMPTMRNGATPFLLHMPLPLTCQNPFTYMPTMRNGATRDSARLA